MTDLYIANFDIHPTKEDLFKDAMEGVDEDFKSMSQAGKVSLSEILSHANLRLRAEWEKSYGCNSQEAMDESKRKEHDSLFNEYKNELEMMVRKRVLSLQKREKVKEISATSIEAILSEMMSEEGLRYNLTHMQYRSKCRILIPGSRILLFYINHKGATYDKIKDQIHHVKLLLEEMEMVEKGIKVYDAKRIQSRIKWEGAGNN